MGDARRFGGQIGQWQELRSGILAAEADPASALNGIPTGHARGVRVAVDLPAGMTGCRLVWGSWVQAMRRKSAGTEVAFSLWVKGGEIGISPSRRSVWIPVEGERFTAHVEALAGVVGDGVGLAYQLTDAAPVEAGPGPVAPTSTGVDLTLADTEYEIEIEAGARRALLRAQDPTTAWRVWFSAGEVAAVGAGFPIAAGETLELVGPFWSFSVYAASSVAGSRIVTLAS